MTPWNKGKKTGIVPRTAFKRGVPSWNKGIPVNRSTKEKIRKNLTRKFSNPENHPRWSGGKSRWNSRQAKIRDDYTCQICGLRDPEIMEVDHIKPRSIFPELDFVMENLMTLCPNCHRRKTLRDKKLYATDAVK